LRRVKPLVLLHLLWLSTILLIWYLLQQQYVKVHWKQFGGGVPLLFFLPFLPIFDLTSSDDDDADVTAVGLPPRRAFSIHCLDGTGIDGGN
jgi:hypothetical protein